jgi:hypothetical protein
MTSYRSDPYAEVTRHGRWTYDVIIRLGMMAYGPDGGPWLIFGRRRAERKAHRELDRYRAKQEDRRDTFIVTKASLCHEAVMRVTELERQRNAVLAWADERDGPFGSMYAVEIRAIYAEHGDEVGGDVTSS